MNKTHFIKHLLLEILGFMITASGAAGCMKMAIGTGAYDAVAVTIASITSLKVGTLGMICNGTCILLQMLILRKNYHPLYLLQIPLVVLLGQMVNLFYYNIYASLDPSLYAVRLVLFVCFVMVSSVGVSLVMSSGMIGMALEGACMAAARTWNLNFGKTRQMVDYVCIAVIIALWFFLKADLSVREGTLIMAVIFGPSLNFLMKYMVPAVKKWIYGSSAVSEH